MKRKLGRGLEALFGGPPGTMDEALGELEIGDSAGSLRSIPLSDLEPSPFQPRRDYPSEELDSLADSIKQHGVIQPIVVRQAGHKFQIIAGERRFRAAEVAGLPEIPARVVEIDDQQASEIALVENLQRSDLNPIEMAQAFESYIGRFGATHEELATRLGRDRSSITNLIRLLELPAAVQEAVRAGQISYGHGRALLTLPDPAEQIRMAKRVIAESLSVREVERLVRQLREANPTAENKPATGKTNHLQSLETELRHRLGTKVDIRPTAKDKGTIVIHFHSHDDFERVMAVLNRS